MNELLEMQAVIRKCLLDIEKAEHVQPKDLDKLSREVSFKTNIILDWQVHNKKIAAIEAKLNDKEYKNYLKFQAEAEIDLLNQELMKKRERQNQYLNDLQKQERHQKLMKRDLFTKMSDREKKINKRTNEPYSQYTGGMNGSRQARSSERLSSHGGVNRTIDLHDLKSKNGGRLPNYQGYKSTLIPYGR